MGGDQVEPVGTAARENQGSPFLACIQRSMTVCAQRAPHRCLATASCERKAFHRVIFKTGCSGSLGVGESFSLHASHQSPNSSLFALPQTSQEYVSVQAIHQPLNARALSHVSGS